MLVGTNKKLEVRGKIMKVAVIYSSTTGNTEAMANAINDAVKAKGAEVLLGTAETVSTAAFGNPIQIQIRQKTFNVVTKTAVAFVNDCTMKVIL